MEVKRKKINAILMRGDRFNNRHFDEIESNATHIHTHTRSLLHWPEMKPNEGRPRYECMKKRALLCAAIAKDPLSKLCYTLNWTEVNRRRCNTQWKTSSFCLFRCCCCCSWVHACVFVFFEVSLYCSFSLEVLLVHLPHSQHSLMPCHRNFCVHVCV